MGIKGHINIRTISRLDSLLIICRLASLFNKLVKNQMLIQKSLFITLCLSRIFLTFFFWMAGLFGIFNFNVIVDEMMAVGLPWPVLFAIGTILCQLTGSALVIFNFAGSGWIGSIMLIVFTLLTIPLGHPFWAFSEPERTKEFHIVLEHITVVGGLMMSAILSGYKR